MHQNLRVAGFPGRYLQGPGALRVVADLARELGATRLLVVSDDVVDRSVGSQLGRQLHAASLPFARLRFGGECTRAAIDSLTNEARAAGGDVVLALGGGKTIDTAKGVSRGLAARLIVAPTIASNDSATSRLIVLYDAEHRVLGVDLLARNPDAVVVDTAEIARAPVRYFRAGIGDAMSKTFEVAQCSAAGGLNFHGGYPPRTAALLGDYCYNLLRDKGQAAIEDVARGQATAVVEDVVEATVLLSGLAFESGGLSIAHAMIRGLSAVPALRSALHGEMVVFGTLVQVVLEQRPREWMADHVSLVHRLGLPVTLGALGKEELAPEELDAVVERTLAAPYAANFHRPLDAALLRQAIVVADGLGHKV